MNNCCTDSSKIGSIGEHYRISSRISGGDFFSDKYVCHRAQFVNLQIRIIGKSRNDKVKRSKSEISLLKFLSHPNLIRLFDVLESQDEIFCVLGPFQGINFYQRIKTLNVYSEKIILLWVMQICSALNFLHENGIVHRCLMINCIYFGRNDILMLDGHYLGHVDEPRLLHSLMQDYPHICAPEVLTGGRCHPSNDMWSLGILVHYLIFGAYPFSSESLVDLYGMILGFASLSGFDKQSPQVKTIIPKLIKRDPTERLTALSAYEIAYTLYLYASREHLNDPYNSLNSSSPSEFSLGQLDKITETIVDESIFNAINQEFDNRNFEESGEPKEANPEN